MSFDEESIDSTPAVVIEDNGDDTSKCGNAIFVQAGETVAAQATHLIDFFDVSEDCEGGYELRNPFVEVLGVWFALNGTGSVLQASSCPALLSVFRGSDCGSLVCAESSSYNDLGCEVEWTSSANGQLDYILVQTIELTGNELGYELPITLTIEDPNSDAEESSGESSAELPLRLNNEDLQLCHETSSKAAVGDTTEVLVLKTMTNTIGFCGDGAVSDGFDLNDMGVQVFGTWFKVAGTGGVLRVNTCPARLTIFTGGDCDNLACADILNHQLGCQIEWQSEEGREDFILVQSIELDSEEDGFTAHVSITVEDLGDNELEDSEGTTIEVITQEAGQEGSSGVTIETTSNPEDDEATGAPTSAPTFGTEEQGEKSDDNPAGEETEESDESGTTFGIISGPQEDVHAVVLKSHQETCQTAKEIIPGSTAFSTAEQLAGDLKECEHRVSLEGMGMPVLGTWLRVAGTGGTMKARACPARITIYQGTSCDDLVCTADDVKQMGCEVEWTSSSVGQFDYILVQAIAFDNPQDAVFSFPVTLKVEASTDFRDPPVAGCADAETVSVHSEYDISMNLPIADVMNCDGGSNTDGHGSIVYGKWFTFVASNDKELRASACPALISVYEGECGAMECMATASGCEVEWKPSRRGAAQLILVQSLRRNTDEKPITLLIETGR
jgi:hypothetical protein